MHRILKPIALALLALPLVVPVSTAQAAPLGSDNSSKAVPGEILVGFADNSSKQARERAAASVDSKSRKGVARGSGEVVELLRLSRGISNARAIDRLRADPAVAFAEPNWRYTTTASASDPYYVNGSLWGMYGDQTSPANAYGSQAGEAWAAGRTGSDSVYVGVIDEGIQVRHADLDANVWTNPYDPADGADNDGNGYVDDVNGWDFAGNNSGVYDGGRKGNADDHGTHVTGTIGAEANGTGVVGVNWNVTAISAKFLGKSGGTTANAIKAVDYITGLKTRHGLNIVATNNSWGGGGYSQGLRDAIARANSSQILFVAAAGNSGSNNNTTPSYPSNYDVANVIAVAAISSSGALASWSSYGPTTVDLGAPGVGVWSTTASNSYSSYSGTSMATPHVTGAAALYASTHPGATAAQIKNAILSSAIPTASLSGKTLTGGRLDANAANAH
jgi:subtilisin family serine protease